MRFYSAALLATVFVGCGTYRTGSGGYNGVGKFKAPSDYSTGVDRGEYSSEETEDLRGHLNGAQSQYIPRGTFKLYWPVAQVHINRGFSANPKHEGLDLGGTRGTPILAAHEGRVIYTGRDFHGYGNMILIEFNNEWATLYGHLDEFAVREGQVVMPGDPIGAMGSTGRATGVHLHFELMHNHQPVDPISLLTRPAITARKKYRPQASRDPAYDRPMKPSF